MPILLPPVPTTIIGSYIHASEDTIWSTGYFFTTVLVSTVRLLNTEDLLQISVVSWNLCVCHFLFLLSFHLQCKLHLSSLEAKPLRKMYLRKNLWGNVKQSSICKSVFINRVKLISANLYERIIILDLLFCSLHIWDNFSRQSTNSFWYTASLKNITRVTESSNTVW